MTGYKRYFFTSGARKCEAVYNPANNAARRRKPIKITASQPFSARNGVAMPAANANAKTERKRFFSI